MQASCLLERLRGSAAASLPSTQAALFQVFSQLLQPLLALQEAFQQEGPLVTRLLKLASAIVENQVGVGLCWGEGWQGPPQGVLAAAAACLACGQRLRWAC